ncbi:mesothelin-like protein [Chanos chanos]|uniref:Mesothelin-like protein n=1 Tax=Chanos chanos TaxID=29144 RepID=A0A6J2VYL1_CHACN|nr:mesothelin-like protein [Chanos chanos]
MYIYVKDDVSFNFTEYPADLLLYFSYSKISPSDCRAYFTALGFADFSVLSSALSFRKEILFSNARTCLGISGTSISRENLDILGNMCCTLDGSYIQNSDPYILEKLKNCPDFTVDQVNAMEVLLLSGNTTYGSPADWTINTLENLGILPLYLRSSFWINFTKREKKRFLRVFIKELRSNGVPRSKIRALRQEAQKQHRTKRSVGSGCTEGEITQVTVNNDAFPFGYNVTQFDACLSVQTLKDNLEEITDKTDDSALQEVILHKLNQAYPGGISDTVVQMLGPASRAATAEDIAKWNITTVDTLSALMKPSDGEWNPDLSKAIISKYLNGAGNSLGSVELNSVGSNLCALDTSTLSSISSSSLRGAGALDISNCTTEKKKALFTVAQSAFSNRNAMSRTTISNTNYQLMQPYLGGAGLTYLRSLSSSNISMDLTTFMSLDPNVIDALSVSDVRGLLGVNLPDLVTYQTQTVVENWIQRQLQSDLDTLNIGLTGGRSTPSTTAPTTAAQNNATAGGSGATTASSGGSGATTASSGGSSATTASSATGLGGLSLCSVTGLHILIVALSTTVLQFLH